jgi:hypothetical protein
MEFQIRKKAEENLRAESSNLPPVKNISDDASISIDPDKTNSS